MDIGSHVADDVLEKYLRHGLAEPDLASVEEHLLVCEKCQIQAEQTEEYIHITRAALLADLAKPPKSEIRARAGFLHSWLTVPVSAAVVAAVVAAAVFLPVHSTLNNRPPVEVSLSALRGPDVVAHVNSGGGLILNLDAKGLPPEGGYGVKLVDSHGAEVWSGVSQSSGSQIRAVVAGKLKPGRYWVRLSRGREPLREYGFQID